MYKITNKRTGFIQYMSNADATNFMNFNNEDNYTAVEVKSFDTENFLYFLLACSLMLVLVFASFWFGLS